MRRILNETLLELEASRLKRICNEKDLERESSIF